MNNRVTRLMVISSSLTPLYEKVRTALHRNGDSLLLPGINPTKGFNPSFYTDSAGTVPAVLDDFIGYANDCGFGNLTFIQPTTVAKPILTKKYNLIGDSVGFAESTHWINNGASGWVDGYGIAPDGTMTTTLCKTGGTKYATLLDPAPNSVYTLSFYCRKANGPKINTYTDSAGTDTGVAFSQIDVGTQTSIGVAGGATEIFIEDNGDFLRIGMAFRTSMTGGRITPHVYVASGELEVWGYQIKQGSTPGRYQNASATLGQYDTNGFPYFLKCSTTNFLTADLTASAATIIDATSDGQVTTAGVSIAGTYMVGPNATTYGRIICKSAPSSADLNLYQTFIDKLSKVT